MATREQWQALTAEFRAAFVELTKIEADALSPTHPAHERALQAARERMRISRENMDKFRAKYPELVD